MIRRRLVSWTCIPKLVDWDDEADDGRGDFASDAFQLVNPQTGQPVGVTVSAQEWRDGWDWQSALDELISKAPPPARDAERKTPRARKAVRAPHSHSNGSAPAAK